MYTYDRVELKKLTKQALTGSWGTQIAVALLAFIGPMVAVYVCQYVFELCMMVTAAYEAIGAFLFIGFLSLAMSVLSSFFLLGPLEIGYAFFTLRFLRRLPISYAYPYKQAFSQGQYLRFVGLYVMMCLFIFLWMLLFFIPGIVKSLAYSMAPYLLLDHPEMGWKEALAESQRMMDGRKGRLFLLELSFIGWILLSALTCGILLIYVIPYMQMTIANYYRFLRGEDIEGAAALPAPLPR